MEKKKVERSSSYPSLSLENALSKIMQLKDSMGLNGEYKRETVATGIGYSTITGTSARAVAALVQYGLLEREKDLYKISELGRRYLVPTSDNDISIAIREAALSPKLFKQIYDEFQGQVLPKLLVNILTTSKYGMQSKVAATVVKLFEAAMTSAQLLEPNGRLTPQDSTIKATSTVDEDATNNKELVAQAQIHTPIATTTNSLDRLLNKQGVNYSGNGWALTVLVESNYRLPPEIQQAIRDLLGSTDSIADQLYNLEQKEE